MSPSLRARDRRPTDPKPPGGRATVHTLTVVVPATDSPSTLDRCLAAIRSSERQPEELIVVTEPTGIGPAAARNQGIAIARSDLVVFVDSDIVLAGDALQRITAAFEADPQLDGIFGAYDDSPADPGLTSRFRNLLHRQIHLSAAGEVASFWAGIGAVRRDRLVALGGFDEHRYPRPMIEDIELGARMAERGWRVRLDPRITGTHLKRWTLRGMVRTDFVARALPWLELVLAGRAPADVLNLGLRGRLAAASSLLAAAFTLARRPRLAAAAVAALLGSQSDLFAALFRRGGPTLALAGLPLLIIHHLTAAAAIPIALAGHLGRRSARAIRDA